MPFHSKYFSICFPLSYMSAIHLSGSEINTHFYHLFFKLHSIFAINVALILKSWGQTPVQHFITSLVQNSLQTCYDICTLETVLKIILSYCTTTLKLGFLHDLIQVMHLGKSIRRNVACLCILTDDTVPTCTPLVMRYSVERYFQLEVYSSS